jgi:hypothetical protein
MSKCGQSLNYLAYHSHAKVCIYASDTVMNIRTSIRMLHIYPKVK